MITAAFAAILATAAIPPAAQEGQDQFFSKFDEALERARRDNKPLFIDFSHPW